MTLILALAAVTGPQAAAQAFGKCLASLAEQARGAGVGEPTLARLLAHEAPDERVLSLDRRQPERVLSLEEYLARVLPKARIRRARAMLVEHRALLERAIADHPVEPELLVALWGIETDFGRVLGGFDTGHALTTLACDPRRPSFFRRELMHLLLLAERGTLESERPRGSWAGAMGQLQFLPSVLARYGVDRDGDGRVSIHSASVDVFATAANYLARSGWRSGRPWGVELDRHYPECPLDRRRCRSSGDGSWQGLEPRTRDGAGVAAAQGEARIISVAGERPRSYLVYENFEALLRWNRSDKYALAVATLTDLLRAAPAEGVDSVPDHK